VTNTASASASRILNLRVGGTSVFSVRRDGLLSVSAGISGGGSYIDAAFSGIAMNPNSSSFFVCGSNSRYAFCSTSTNAFITPDTFLGGPAPATLQLGQNASMTPTAQTIRAHGVTTGTGASLTLQGGSGSVARGNVVLHGGNRAAYDAAPSTTVIRDILISHGLMNPS